MIDQIGNEKYLKNIKTNKQTKEGGKKKREYKRVNLGTTETTDRVHKRIHTSKSTSSTEFQFVWTSFSKDFPFPK